MAGATNGLVDVDGLLVGHAQVGGDGALSGTTVVVASGDGDGAVGGVDVRGGGPGTRETDLLDPWNLVERVHSVVLSGGSAYGLAAADGVMARLAQDHRGFPVGVEPGEVVPIVPAAVVFDLGRGGRFTAYPTAEHGAAAYDDAVAAPAGRPVAQGVVGAGTGTVVGGLKGGVGSASVVLPDGATVAALVAVNAAGTAVDGRTGELYGARFALDGELDGLPPLPTGSALTGLLDRLGAVAASPTLATTLAVVGTDVTLSKAQCQKVAGVGHDGMARALRPVHGMTDGDTVFTLSTTRRPAPDIAVLQLVLAAAADCVTRAIVRALLAAESVATPAGSWPSYPDLLRQAST